MGDHHKEDSYFFDNQVKYAENQSLKLMSDNTGKDFVAFQKYFTLAGKNINKVKITAKIKYENIEEFTGIWLRVHNENGERIFFNNMEKQNLNATKDWQDVSIEFRNEKNEKLSGFFFGGIIQGSGIAWFDNFEIYINAQKWEEKQPFQRDLTQEEEVWLKQNIYPIKSVDLKEKNSDDLKFLSGLIGNSKIVALGESTHGSREVFLMKNRLVKYLTENLDFDIFSLEAYMPESYQMNQFTLNNKGYLLDYLKNIGFWTWKTEEIEQLIKWMKEYNSDSNKKIQFTGFDMQSYKGSISVLKKFFDEESVTTEKINGLESLLKRLDESRKEKKAIDSVFLEDINKQIQSIRIEIPKLGINDYQSEWLYRNLRIIEQFLDKNPISRDKYMAENILWIKKHNPDSKMVLWAHNEHIKKTEAKMGEFLQQELKEDYLSFGFAFYQGNYTAHGNKGLTTYKAEPAYLGTIEFLLNSVESPIFLIDIRKIKKEKPEELGAWILETMKFRKIGALNRESEFQYSNISDDFDFLIFINTSSASKLIKE